MNLLEILELQPGCSKEDVKKSFRRLSFLYHPDKHPSDKNSEESFIKILNAYELLEKDPSLLTKNISSSSSGDIIYAELGVTIEDLYFEKKKSINIKRTILCPTCSGLGTENIKQGLCNLCRGTGKIDNKILDMFKKNNTYACPYCNGFGVKKEFICLNCNGKKLKEEVKEYSLRLELKNFSNCIILNGKGNQYPNCLAGDVIIKLKIGKDTKYKIEKDILCVDFYITPTQRLIGDDCKIEIFGKIFKFRVPVLNDRLIIEDKRKEFLSSHKILIQVYDKKPILNKEIIELYKKILILEKESTTPF